MIIVPNNITIRQLYEGYVNNDEEGVRCYEGKLDIRPPYQREFIYNEKDTAAVINTIIHKLPLNVMYWSVRKDGKFEIIDGQQRTLSVCKFINNDFSYQFPDNIKYFKNLENDVRDQILDFELMIYKCSGTDTERLDWFRIINMKGAILTPQELRNAVYSGPWVSHAKGYFSKTSCPAYEIAQDYLTGIPIRQKYLETAIKWIAKGVKIDKYMAIHQDDPNADILWNYFRKVINWVETTFTVKRNKMKSVDWGSLYNEFKDEQFDSVEIEKEIKKLILDDDVTKISGIYEYILTRDEKYLSMRAFSENMKQKAYEKQDGKCVKCNKEFELSEMDADHIKPWSKGGKTTEKNCQLLCIYDNRS